MNMNLWYILIVIFSSLVLASAFCIIKGDSGKNIEISSLITGIVVIPYKKSNTEFVLRKLAVYIQKNNMDCFRKILIQVDRRDSENIMICRGICEQYSIFELQVE